MPLVDLDLHGARLFDGGWRPSDAGTREVIEPATGTTLATVGVAQARQVRAATAAAERAQPGWAALSPLDRAEVLHRAADLVREHAGEILEWIIRECGAVRGRAEAELGSVRDELRVAAALVAQPHGHVLPGAAGEQSIAYREPLGVVGVISPWNVPLLLGMRAVAPALVLGNAVVLKPDERTPVSGGLVLARLFELAGLPPGVLHVLPGAAAAGSALVDDPRVAMIAFTGSTAVGRRIGAAAGGALKRMSLELGGNNALIVLDDADVDAAAAAGAFAAFHHQGQVCMAASRHIVLHEVAERYLTALVKRAEQLSVGDPWTEPVELGPLIDRGQLERVRGIVADSVAAGAQLRCGGTARELFHRPTVLTGVTRAMPAFTEEIFGPVAPVVTVADEDEAVAVANDTEYGLVASVLTGSAERGLRVARRLRTGMVHVNDQTIADDAYVPFGGRGASGNGSRHGALHSWDEFTRWRWVTSRPDIPAYPG